MKIKPISASKTVELRDRFEQCKKQLLALDLISQGTLVESRPGAWRWTRKVKAKTVSVTLLPEQADGLRRAISQNRHLEKLLDQMRILSQQLLLESFAPPPRRKPARKHPKPSLS